MSVDYSVYVGPYLECKTKQVPTTLNITSCVNHECPNYRVRLMGEQPPYCPHCGDEIGSYATSVMREEPDNTDLYEDEKFQEIFDFLHGDVADRLQNTRNVHIYVPNEIRAPGFTFDPRGEFDVRELNPKSLVYDPARWKAQVDGTSAFKKLVQMYGGFENVVFKWGVINTAS